MKFQETDIPSNRYIGYLFIVAFCSASVFFFAIDLLIYVYVFTVFFVLAALAAYFSNNINHRLNFLWFRFCLLLGIVFGPIMLSLIFFGLITPLAYMMRLYGRDKLCLRINIERSYWSRRKSKNYYVSFKKQL